jgi:hypothetical protein
MGILVYDPIGINYTTPPPISIILVENTSKVLIFKSIINFLYLVFQKKPGFLSSWHESSRYLGNISCTTYAFHCVWFYFNTSQFRHEETFRRGIDKLVKYSVYDHTAKTKFFRLKHQSTSEYCWSSCWIDFVTLIVWMCF